MIIRWSTGGN